MPKTNLLSKKMLRMVAVVMSMFTLIAASFLSSPIVPPPDANNSCSNISTPVINSWFASGTATLNGLVMPANSVTFNPTSNCSFYAWSEQMFLWLTSPVNGGIVLNSPAFFDISPADTSGARAFIPHQPGVVPRLNLRAAQLGPHGLPITFEKGTGRMLEIEKTPVSATGKPLLLNSAGKKTEVSNIILDAKNKHVFLDINNKPILKARAMAKAKFVDATNKSTVVHKFMRAGKAVFLNSAGAVIEVEEGQAGGGDVLISQNGSLVYYTMSANQVYAYFRMMQPSNPSSSLQFPTTQTTLNSIVSFASSQVPSVTITAPQALAIEIKTSWVDASTLPDPQNYITMQAVVPKYNKSNPAKWIPAGEQQINLAMVGMHIVGSTNGHPEMLWATFEHVSNTPDATYNYLNNSQVKTNVPQNTSGAWTFCANGASSNYNNALQQVSGDTIVAVAPNTVIGPSNTIRWKAWGTQLGGNDASLNSEVISGNNNVNKVLINGDLRKNYMHIGTTWTNGQAPNSTNQKGTTSLANSTMETYQQGTSASATTINNCFGCHGTNTVAVSHVFIKTKKIAN